MPYLLIINLIKFKGAVKDKQIELIWTTSNEINSSHFEIEWSADGKIFNSIGKISAQGHSNTPTLYQFTDAPPSKVNYYRLKMVETDGTISLSKIIVLNIGQETEIMILPNPNKGYFTFSLNGLTTQAQNLVFQVFDLNGKMMTQHHFSSINLPINQQIYLHHLSKGVYTIKVLCDKKVLTKQLLID